MGRRKAPRKGRSWRSEKCQKVAYKTKALAIQAKSQPKAKTRAVVLYEYRCHDCHAWHLTRSPQRFDTKAPPVVPVPSPSTLFKQLTAKKARESDVPKEP